MVEKRKLRTDKKQVLGWIKTNKPNLDYVFENKFVKSRGIFAGNYIKNFFRLCGNHLENTNRIEISLTTNRDCDAKMIVFKNLDTNEVVCLSGLIYKNNPGLKGKKGIGNKKY